jgi:hypothetical protein
MISGIKNEVGRYKEKFNQFPKIVIPYVKRYGSAIIFATGFALNVVGLPHLAMKHPEGAIVFGAGLFMMYGATLREQLKGNQERASQKQSLVDHLVAIEFAESLRDISTEKEPADS